MKSLLCSIRNSYGRAVVTSCVWYSFSFNCISNCVVICFLLSNCVIHTCCAVRYVIQLRLCVSPSRRQNGFEGTNSLDQGFPRNWQRHLQTSVWPGIHTSISTLSKDILTLDSSFHPLTEATPHIIGIINYKPSQESGAMGC